jgi:hypothetical protein
MKTIAGNEVAYSAYKWGFTDTLYKKGMQF